MKTLGSFINKKTIVRRSFIDEKSIFYVFGIIIKEEYGKQGVENIIPISFSDGRIFVRFAGNFWEKEFLLKKAHIMGKINKELGGSEIVDLVMNQ